MQGELEFHVGSKVGERAQPEGGLTCRGKQDPAFIWGFPFLSSCLGPPQGLALAPHLLLSLLGPHYQACAVQLAWPQALK